VLQHVDGLATCNFDNDFRRALLLLLLLTLILILLTLMLVAHPTFFQLYRPNQA
jgi:hypothetical protein